MPWEYSEDLYWHIIYLHSDRLLTTDIANTLHISKGIVNKIKKRYNHWAYITNLFKNIFGRRKLVSRENLAILRNLVAEKVNWYLDELVYEMENLTEKNVSIVTL